MDTHRDVYIALKKSLKWVPIVGWVCETKAALGVFLGADDVPPINQTLFFAGHAILQLYLFGALVGVRQTVSCEPPSLVGPTGARTGHPAHVHLVP